MNQKKIIKKFKKAAKNGTLGRGTLVKKYGKGNKLPCSDCGSPVRSTAITKSTTPGKHIDRFYTDGQILDFYDRSLLTRDEARYLLGIAHKFKKEVTNDSDSAGDETQAPGEKEYKRLDDQREGESVELPSDTPAE